MSNGIFIFGLDEENIRRLVKEKEPIYIDLSMMGGTDKFILIFGKTLEDAGKEIERLTGVPLPSIN